MDEVYKNITGYNGCYQISNKGKVISLKFGRLKRLKTHIGEDGYKRVRLSNKKTKMFLVHRLVALHFLDNKNNYPIINHKNGIKSDNVVSNLEWCDYSHNLKHSYDIGTHKPSMLGKFGKNHNRHKQYKSIES